MSCLTLQLSDAFPEAVSILDYYHVCEHLPQFARTIFTGEAAQKKWTDKQKELLLQSKVTKVISNIKKQNCESEDALSIINYYTNNVHRMDYQRYKNIGAGIIGSGTISRHTERWYKRG